MIVRDISELKRLANRGIVVLHDHTGKKVINAMGGESIAHYVEEVRPNKEGYSKKYIDGCFMPYVNRE